MVTSNLSSFPLVTLSFFIHIGNPHYCSSSKCDFIKQKTVNSIYFPLELMSCIQTNVLPLFFFINFDVKFAKRTLNSLAGQFLGMKINLDFKVDL